jgi:HlyD family secretion protein
MKWPFFKPKATAAAADDAAPSFMAKPKAQSAKGQAVVEYLPDADEIERSPLPRLAQFTLHILIVALVVFIVWASVSELDEVVTAQGRLASPLPNVVVQPLETAIVQSVDVRIGQVVKKGDKLATLDATFAQADESQLQIRLSSLETQIRGLEAELSGALEKGKAPDNPDTQLQANLLIERRANYRAQQDRLSENMAKLRAALQTNRKDQLMVQSRLRSVKEIEAMQEKMVTQKYAAPLQLLEAQQRSKEVERELEQTSSHEQELKREYAALEAEKLGFEKSWRQKTLEEMLSVTRERDALQQQIQKADKRSQMITLLSPVDAVVLDIAKLSPGSIVQGAETFFTLVPLNTKLEAEVQINSMDVGYIKVGDKVHLKLDAFPFQRHGTLEGSVRTISEDAFRRDANNKGALDAYYLSRITLDSTALRNMIESARLLPGMTLSAELVVGRRTIMSYLAWPLTKGLDEAVREPK